MTAVEWFKQQISTCSLNEIDDNINYWFEQAKQMEKEQIIKAWMATDNELQRIAAEKYYNETYNKK